MNITFLVNYDLASTLALNYLLPNLTQHDVSVFFTHKKSTTNSSRLIELARFESTNLQNLNKPTHTLQLNSIYKQSEFCSNPIVKLNNVNSNDFHQLSGTKPDLIISIRHMTILQKVVIGLPKYGVLNLHSGLLPNYQGVMASFWAMLNAEKKLGTTLHYIKDSSIDTGAIISRSQQTCDYSKSYLWNVFNVYKAGCKTIVETINKISLDKNIQCSEQSGKSQYFSFPTESDLIMFTKRGYVLFNQNDLIDFQLTN